MKIKGPPTPTTVLEAGKRYRLLRFDESIRDQILRFASLSDVFGDQGKQKIVWINDKPYVLR